jgi:hypothetical protein
LGNSPCRFDIYLNPHPILSGNLEIPIERCNPLFQSTTPLANVSQENPKLLGPSLTTAEVLAMGKASRINVLPEELRYSIKNRYYQIGSLFINSYIYYFNISGEFKHSRKK